LYVSDAQTCEDDRYDFAEQLRTATPAALDAVQLFVQRLRFGGVVLGRHLFQRRLQIAQHGGSIGVVLAMERHQLGEDVVATLQAGMTEYLSSGDDLVGDAAEALSDFDAAVTRVLAEDLPVMAQSVKVMVALDQVVGGAQDGRAQFAVAAANERSVGLIDLVALIARGAQTGAARDCPRVGVVLDRAHLAGEIAGADHIDAGKGEQQDVRGTAESGGDVAFQGRDFLGFLAAIVVESEGEAVADGCRQVWGSGLRGPVEHGRKRAALIANAGSVKAMTQGVEAGGAQLLGRVLADLGAQHDGLAHEFAAMPNEQLQRGPCFIEPELDQSEAVDRGEMDRGQVVVIGLVAGVARLSQPTGGEGMTPVGPFSFFF
jgi:hypothetical protein